MTDKIDLPAGALELLILTTLTRGAEHGYGLTKAIREASGRALAVEEGSLYPALHRMERHGWIEAEWDRTPSGREAKYYRLTRKGRSELKARTRPTAPVMRSQRRVLGLRPHPSGGAA